jgi:rhodanese-related sulfurtransferase
MAPDEEGPVDLGIDFGKLAGLIDAGFTAPDVVGTVEGWRAWRVKLEAPRFGTVPKLQSASYNYWWTPRVKARAECRKCRNPDPVAHDHVPGTHCTCGFYSAKTLDHLRSMGYHAYDENGGYTSVVGQLANWGRVIEGSQGWRAEFAYPAVMFVPFEAWRLRKPLMRAYGVPVKLLNLLDDSKYPEEAKQMADESEVIVDE